MSKPEETNAKDMEDSKSEVSSNSDQYDDESMDQFFEEMGIEQMDSEKDETRIIVGCMRLSGNLEEEEIEGDDYDPDVLAFLRDEEE